MMRTLHYCKVGYCRYSKTHVTKGHKCGKCGAYGHGDFECGNNRMQDMLKQYYDDVLPDYTKCTVVDCTEKNLHTAAAHHCSKCGKREAHSLQGCSVSKTYYVKCPLCRTDNIVANPVQIKGLSDKCSICLENNVEILFPSCGHVCVCKDCLENI